LLGRERILMRIPPRGEGITKGDTGGSFCHHHHHHHHHHLAEVGGSLWRTGWSVDQRRIQVTQRGYFEGG